MNDWNDQNGHVGNGFGWFIAFLVFALVIAGVVGLIVAITRTSSPSPSSSGPDKAQAVANKARGILDERFARGDIAVDEYRERRSALDE